jgi:uncharacterized protein YggT (Ycf19 family)
MEAMDALVVALRVVTGVIMLDVVLGFIAPCCAAGRLTRQMTAPLYRPIQSVCDPKRVGADFSPMVLVMGLTTLAWLIAPDLVS